MICKSFTPATGEITDIVGAISTGGINIICSTERIDLGENVANCQKNTKELMKNDSTECKMSGTMLTVTTTSAKLVMGSADIDETDTTKVTPRKDLDQDDFTDIWFVCDYSDLHGATNGGYAAVKLKNALSTGGFSLQSVDKEKGEIPFEFTGYGSTEEPDVIPLELYVKAGAAEPVE